jgi:hypothetical protein
MVHHNSRATDRRIDALYAITRSTVSSHASRVPIDPLYLVFYMDRPVPNPQETEPRLQSRTSQKTCAIQLAKNYCMDDAGLSYALFSYVIATASVTQKRHISNRNVSTTVTTFSHPSIRQWSR